MVESADKTDRTTDDRRSLAEAWAEVVADASGLVQAEAGLARAETATNLRALLRSAIIILAGVLLCMIAITFLSVAAVVGLAALIGLGLALLFVATAAGMLGVLFFRLGLIRMESLNILPDKSIGRISEDLRRLSARGRALTDVAGPGEPGSAHYGDSRETP